MSEIEPLCKVSILVFLKYRISREFLLPMWLFGENTKGFVCHNYQGAPVIKKKQKQKSLENVFKTPVTLAAVCHLETVSTHRVPGHHLGIVDHSDEVDDGDG